MTAGRKLAKKKGGKREGETHLDSFLLSSDRWKQPLPVLLIIVMETRRKPEESIREGVKREERRNERERKKKCRQTDYGQQNCSRGKMAKRQTGCDLPAEAGKSARPSDASRLDRRDDRKEQLCHFSSAAICSQSCNALQLPRANASSRCHSRNMSARPGRVCFLSAKLICQCIHLCI